MEIAMIYVLRAANSLKRNHAEFWRQLEQSRPEHSSALLDKWAQFVESARRHRLDPDAAAKQFVELVHGGSTDKPFA